MREAREEREEGKEGEKEREGEREKGRQEGREGECVRSKFMISSRLYKRNGSGKRQRTILTIHLLLL